MTMNNPENRLWATALQLAGEAGMEYTVPCSGNLCDLITAGAREMSREGRIAEEDWEKADASLSQLIREMILATRELGSGALSGGKIKIREAALVQSKKLCPLWPFG
jgi:hypothetical protein